MKLDSKEELLTDFHKMISSLDFKNYNPSSPDFMSALFIGMMWQLLSDLPDAGSGTFCPDIMDELDSAERYLNHYMETSDMQYKQMAADELRHAKILINEKSSQELTHEEEEMLESYEHRRSNLAEKLV